MSVVSTVEAVPNRVLGVARYLAAARGASDEDVRRAIQPPALRENDSTVIVERTLRACEELGIAERDGTTWVLADPSRTDEELHQLIADRLTGAVQNDSQAQVSRALAWFLTLDPFEPLLHNENWRGRVEADLDGDACELTDLGRCQQFAIWAVHLGFAWRLAAGGRSQLVPDPTEALARHLAVVLAGGELPLQEAIERVAQCCPVLEFGAVREACEGTLPPGRSRAAQTLSRATSFALQRLVQRGFIRLRLQADHAQQLQLARGERVSHIALREAAS